MSKIEIVDLSPASKDREAVIAFLSAVIDGYEHPSGFHHKIVNKHLRKLKDFFKEVRDKSAILSLQGNPNRIHEASCDKLHAATWRIHHEIEKLKNNPNSSHAHISVLSDLRDYCYTAFHRTYEISSGETLNAAKISRITNANKTYPPPPKNS